MKTFLKPTAAKIILAFILFLLFSWLWRMCIVLTISDTFPLGFPLHFFLAWGPCPPGKDCSEFNGLYLVLDILFWYLIGTILVPLFQKRQDKK